MGDVGAEQEHEREHEREAQRERTRALWSGGDYAQTARLLEPAAQELARAAGAAPGRELLDVAAGTGNVAAVAARAGARVTASDLAPAMVARGRARTEEEGLDVAWLEADAEALPFADGSFDIVTSAFGAMFAPRPDAVAAEFWRVLRPGGVLALATWTPESFPGRNLALVRARYAPPPAGQPNPVEWGREEVVRARLEGGEATPVAASVSIARHALRWEFPSPEAYWELLDCHAPPLVAMREALSADDYACVRADTLALLAEDNRADDGRLVLEPTYLVAVARGRC